MLIEFRYSDGSAFERTSLGGPKIEFAATQEGVEQRMVALGAPADFAKRAAARHMRALANPRPVTRASSLQERVAAVTKLVNADIAAGRVLDANTQARIAAITKLVDADRKAGLV